MSFFVLYYAVQCVDVTVCTLHVTLCCIVRKCNSTYFAWHNILHTSWIWLFMVLYAEPRCLRFKRDSSSNIYCIHIIHYVSVEVDNITLCNASMQQKIFIHTTCYCVLCKSVTVGCRDYVATISVIWEFDGMLSFMLQHIVYCACVTACCNIILCA